MADLRTETTHTLVLTAEELAAFRRGMTVASAATKDDPNAKKDRRVWERLAHVGQATRDTGDAPDEEAPARPRPTVWGTGRATHTPGR